MARPKLVKVAVESVLSQKDVSLELIIVNDGARDETPKVLEEIKAKDPRVTIITNDKNLGISASVNKALTTASGKYIARLDDDDFWIDRYKLKKQVAFLDSHPDYVLVGTGVRVVNEHGEKTGELVRTQHNDKIYQRLLFSNRFTNATVLYRKSALDQIGLYDKGLIFGNDDYDLVLRLGQIGKMHNLPDICVAYRKTDNNYSKKFAHEILRSNIDLVKKYRNKYPNYRMAILYNYYKYLFSFLKP
ncbi:glycosyltransferase [Patescibacteria group bacterium]|nr:glycosyltransferase [Patescibacteria group bacterium]MBU1890858.1 glycosyltransferase [Patescibacteria group bacterium]